MVNYRNLNEGWDISISNCERGEKNVTLPETMLGALLKKGRIPDPYFRDNELELLKYRDAVLVLSNNIVLTKEELECDECKLRFEGVDTLGELIINGNEFVKAFDNMHKSYEFSLKDCCVPGKNRIELRLISDYNYIKEKNEKIFAGGSHECTEGFPHIRKAHCLYGWDWGPRIYDRGIYRDVFLVTRKDAWIKDCSIVQKPDIKKAGADTADVSLHFELSIQENNGVSEKEINDLTEIGLSGYEIRISVNDIDGRRILNRKLATGTSNIKVSGVKLWYPAGYGEQALYDVEVSLWKNNLYMDSVVKRMGFRKMELNREKTFWGEKFCHRVNGLDIFAMGADYVPEDNLLGRISRERTVRLLEDAAFAGHNTIRVWGGGYYPDEYFYDTCDELGILVWQDFMYACANYELDDEFEKNITEESIQVVKRLRHHPCLALWCGNNEMETQTLDGAWKPSIKQKYDYIKLFEYILPKIVAEYDTLTPYWPSSPSSGGNYDNPWDGSRGDTHYWAVWHGERPFTDVLDKKFDYVSEFGFQSFPSEKTVDSFALPEDKNLFSRIMEMHQRCPGANGKFMKYMGMSYLYPTTFSKLILYSQLLQAEGMKMAIEHFRRLRGRCMGAIVWQLNDIWPGASWSSIDYYGRLKPLHYMEKRCFEKIHISAEEHTESLLRSECVFERKEPLEFSVRLHVANETAEEIKGSIRWALRKNNGELVKAGTSRLTVMPFDGAFGNTVKLADDDSIFDTYLEYAYYIDRDCVSSGTSIFTRPKHFRFLDPELKVSAKGDKLVITAQNYAKNVCIEGVDADTVFSDNCFDMGPGEKIIEIVRNPSKEYRIDSVYLGN